MPEVTNGFGRRAQARMTAAWLGAVALLLAACEDHAQTTAQQPPPPAVGVAAATIKGVRQSYEFIGRVQAVDIVDVYARVTGTLEKRLFTEGGRVNRGDTLYTIEREPFQAEVQQRWADVKRAEAALTNATLQLTRGEELLKRGNIPQATVDDRRAAKATAEADLLAAKAALEEAEINLGYTTITSPIAGKIGRTRFTVGNLVGPDSGVLATIVSQDPIYVTFPVSQRELLQIRDWREQGDGSLIKIEFTLQLPDGRQYPHTGSWDFTGVQVDEATDTIAMRATFPNPDGALVDGQFATVFLRGRQAQESLVVPQAALQTDQAGRYVLVVNSENKVEQRRVTVGQTQGTDAVIESGLKEGEKVIVEGLQKVRPGQVVTTHEAATATKA